MAFRRTTGVVPMMTITRFQKKWRRMEGQTEDSYITMKEAFNESFLQFTTKPHSTLSLEKKLKFKPKVFYYKEIKENSLT